jgi:hypothetical protein
MPPFDRHLWRLAGRLAERIARLQRPDRSIVFDNALWFRARGLKSRLDSISEQNWQVAGEHLRWQLVSTIQRLHAGLGTILRDLPAGGRIPVLPNQHQMYEELLAVQDEFEDFDFDVRRRTLSVTTDEITLEDVALGRFRILLDVTSLGSASCFRVSAKTPNYSASRSDVTHPHVLDDYLCEGDADAPLDCALRTGRLGDFFQIVQQTLKTYNAESAYASLDNWEDTTTCHSCGDSVPEHSTRYCDRCSADTCQDCSRSCPHCGDSACDYCIDRCPGCEEQSCGSCLQSCQRCQLLHCPDCLTESSCEACHALAFPSTDSAGDASATTITTTTSSDTPVFADSVGQAAVPAGSG